MAERGVIFKDDFVSTPGKSWFDMSFDYLFSMNFGELVPSTCMECMAGDVIHAKSDSFVRLAPLVAPTFGKVNMYSYHFYVRNRSIWKSWESFFAEADQRESWQQSIQGGFVPPEMPYLRPLHVLDMLTYCDYVFGNTGFTPTNDNAISGFSVYSDYLGLIGASNVKLLVITAASGGSVEICDSSNDQFKCLFNYDVSDSNAERIFVAFMPNKYDAHNVIPSSQWPFTIDPISDVYNPFSNGSLFDYLGVDLSGHYYKQYDYMRGSIGKIRTALSDTGFKLNLSANGDVDCDGSFLINLQDFVRRYHVVATGYLHNDQCVTIHHRSGLYYLDSVWTQTHAADIAALNTNADPLYNWDSKISTLPLRAYWSIYIDYFRDENYISVNSCIDFSRDGEDAYWPDMNVESTNYNNFFDYLTLNYKAYEHDPYTTALPQAQRGAAVRFMNDATLKVSQTGLTPSTYSEVRYSNGQLVVTGNTSTSATYSSLIVDLSAATIENFRFANATQKLLEKIARSGNRYYEYMKAIYGVVIDDAKIDRPIYLSGDKSPIQISEVLQTSASEVTTDQPLGQMAGRGVSVGNDDYIEYITPDNGFFIEICCALPRTNYQQGLAPYFHRFDRLDFAIPDYAQLGEQQVPQRELWYSANESDDETPFGYQSRYYDYKYLRDRTSGSFKDSLSFWTWSRIFDQAPIAGKEFIEVRPDYRQFAVTDKNVEHVFVHMWHDIQVNRCLPVFGTPSL